MCQLHTQCTKKSSRRPTCQQHTDCIPWKPRFLNKSHQHKYCMFLAPIKSMILSDKEGRPQPRRLKMFQLRMVNNEETPEKKKNPTCNHSRNSYPLRNTALLHIGSRHLPPRTTTDLGHMLCRNWPVSHLRTHPRSNSSRMGHRPPNKSLQDKHCTTLTLDWKSYLPRIHRRLLHQNYPSIDQEDILDRCWKQHQKKGQAYTTDTTCSV